MLNLIGFRRGLFVVTFVFAMQTVNAQEGFYNIQDYKRSVTLSYHDLRIDSSIIAQKGKDAVWNLAGLDRSASSTSVQILSPDSVADAEFPNTNFVEKYANGSFLAYSKEGGRTYLMGYYDPNNKVKIQYTLPMLVSKRPLFYGDKIITQYHTVFRQGEKEIKSSGQLEITAEGYGRLLFSDKQYDEVLRLKLEQVQEDELGRFDSINRVKMTTYYWYDRNSNSPLLKYYETVSGGKKRAILQRVMEESGNLNIK